MAEVGELWQQALPKILNGVTGRGVWAAINAAKPLLEDEGVLVLGMPTRDTELAGHLRLPATSRFVEQVLTGVAGRTVRIRVIDGQTLEDYELVKRRDAERRRLQQQEMEKMRAEMTARTSWEQVYEQLSRRYAAVTNKTLPQNRARFYEEALELIADARREMQRHDDAAERNFARCIERVAQYADVPSTLVAQQILQRAGEL